MFIVLKQQICRVPYQHGLSSALAVYVGTTLIAMSAADRLVSCATIERTVDKAEEPWT